MFERLFFIFIVILGLSSIVYSQYDCSTPCNPRFPTCQNSFCEYGICQATPKNPLPVGCCKSSVDCLVNDPCVGHSCNFETNECEYIPLCSIQSSDFDDHFNLCSDNRDCDDDDLCSDETCIDGFCVTSPNPNTADLSCCQTAADCAPQDCRIAYCPQDTFKCTYATQYNCVVSNELSSLYNNDETSSSSSSDTEEEEEEPGAGDIIGAIIGFIILGALIIAFIIVIILMLIQKVVRRLTSE